MKTTDLYKPQVQLYFKLPGKINEAISAEDAKMIAFKITGAFEGGKVNSVQMKDSGVISYGKHQATLSSGSLYRIIELYTRLSFSKVAKGLQNYLSRLQSKDPSLKSDNHFIDLLLQASNDPLMEKAQDKIFTDFYWKPVIKTASELGIKSGIGMAILYDTNVQGGFNLILDRTETSTRLKYVTEKQFLSLFLENRRKYLYSIAAVKRQNGDATTAKLLENSAKNRVGKLFVMLNAYL